MAKAREEVSYREFGRQMGVSVEAVRKAIQSGRIPAAALGEKRLNTGGVRPCIIDTAMAAAGWQSNTNKNQQRPKSVMSAGGKRGRAMSRGEDLPPDEHQEVQVPAGGKGPGGVPPQATSNAITAAYKARMAKIEYEMAVGKLVDGETIKVKLTEMIVTARNKILGVPGKAKQRIPHLTLDDIEEITELLVEALEDVSGSV